MANYVNLTGVGIANVLNGAVNKTYSCNLPAVTKENFSSLAGQLRAAPDRVQNAWQEGLIDIIGLQMLLNSRKFTSYFRVLHKQPLPTFDIQLIMIDLIKAKSYSPKADMEDYFEDAPARVGAQYAHLNLQAKFPLSINEESLYGALTSETIFMDYVNALRTSMYNSLEMADVATVKELINKNLAEGNIFLKVTSRPVDRDSALAFTKDVKSISADMAVEMTPRYNLSGFNTITQRGDGVVITDTETQAITETYSLAWAFNESYLSMQEGGRGITMQNGSLAGGKVFGLYGDKEAFRIHPIIGFPKIKTDYFGNTMTKKDYLHWWAMYIICYFENLVAFTDPNSITIPQNYRMASEKHGRIEGHYGNTESALASTYAHIDRGGNDRLYVDELVFHDGTTNPLFDKFGTYTITGANVVYNEGGYFQFTETPPTDPETAVDPITGMVYVGKNETVEAVAVTWTSHLDQNERYTERFLINGNYTPGGNGNGTRTKKAKA